MNDLFSLIVLYYYYFGQDGLVCHISVDPLCCEIIMSASVTK